MKRLLSLTVCLVVILSLFSLSVSANESNVIANQMSTISYDDVMSSAQAIQESNTTSVIIYHNDGTVTEESYDTSVYSQDQLFTSAYTPITNNTMSSSSIPGISPTSYSPSTNIRVGRLEAVFYRNSGTENNLVSSSSATLIHYDLLLSAAHCVWSPEFGFCDELTYYAAQTSQNGYLNTATKEQIFLSTALINSVTTSVDENGDVVYSYNSNYDWSIIQINKNLGGSYGWYGTQVLPSNPASLSLEMYGYPSMDGSTFTQYRSYGELEDVFGNLIIHTAPGRSGISGAALLNNNTIYGIHTAVVEDPEQFGYDYDVYAGVKIFNDLQVVILNACQASAERWE